MSVCSAFPVLCQLVLRNAGGCNIPQNIVAHNPMLHSKHLNFSPVALFIVPCIKSV